MSSTIENPGSIGSIPDIEIPEEPVDNGSPGEETIGYEPIPDITFG